MGSGRPVDSRVAGDPNQDSNDMNDRLPGVGRNAFLGPDYATTDLRLTRRIHVGDRLKLVGISDVGSLNSTGQFTQYDKTIGIRHFPAYFTSPSDMLKGTDAYAPRQVQFGLKLIF